MRVNDSLEKADLESLASAPSSPSRGRVYFDTTLGVARIYNGSAWVTFAGKVIQSKTAIYTILSSDDEIFASGAAFTLTAPAATSVRPFRVTKTDAGIANLITVARAGSDSFIENASVSSTTLGSLGESILFTPDGVSKFYLTRSYPKNWLGNLTFTPSAGFGTPTLSSIWWKRDGDELLVRGYFKAGTLAASSGSIALPTGYVIDSAKFAATSNAQGVGIITSIKNSATDVTTSVDGRTGELFYDGNDTARVYVSFKSGSAVLVKSNMNGVANDNDGFEFRFSVPIVGWN